MPTYTLRNDKTEETQEMFCSYDELQVFLKENLDWYQEYKAPALVTHTGNMVNKTSGDWQDHLKRIKKNSGSQSTIKV